MVSHCAPDGDLGRQAERFLELGHELVVDSRPQALLRTEVVLDQADRDGCLGRNFSHRHAVKTASREQLQRGVQQASTPVAHIVDR